MNFVNDTRRAWVAYSIMALCFLGFYTSFHLVRSRLSDHSASLAIERVVALFMFADWLLLALFSLAGILSRTRVGAVGLATALFFLLMLLWPALS
jgi:hypothetical protein